MTSISVGGTTFSPETGDYASGTDFTSPFVVHGTNANVTGALGSTARPILISSASVVFRSGTSGTVRLSCSTSIGGGNYSGDISGSGTKTYDPALKAFVGNTVYLGFQKRDSLNVLFQRAATTTPQGGAAQPSAIYRDGGTSSSTYDGTSIRSSALWAAVPAAPTISSTSFTTDSVTVSWAAPSENGGSSITGYRILYRPTGGAWSSTGKLSSTARTHTISPLSANTTYEILLAATNGVSDAHNSSYTSTSSHTGTNASTTVKTDTGDAYPVFTSTQGTWRVGQYSTETISATPATAISLIEFSGEELSTFGLSSTVSSSGNTRTLTIFGTPTKSGTFVYNVSATNGSSTDILFEEISIATPTTPSWPDLSFKAAQSGEAYSDTVTASNAASVVVDSISIPGLSTSVSGATITLSGTPNVSASQTFSIGVTAYSATDNGTAISRSATLSVYIAKANPPAWSKTSIATTARVDNDYSDYVFAENASSYSVVSGSLPPGLSLNSGTGYITGRPTRTGQFEFTIRASNSLLSATPDQTFIMYVVLGARIYSPSNAWNANITHAQRWDGSSWVNISHARRWNGTAWVPVSR